jgi:hypothetical protein
MTGPLEGCPDEYWGKLITEEHNLATAYTEQLMTKDYDDLSVEDREAAIYGAVDQAGEDVRDVVIAGADCDGQAIGDFADRAGYAADDPRRHAYLITFAYNMVCCALERDAYVVRFDADGGDDILAWATEAEEVNGDRAKTIARYFIPAPNRGRKASKERLKKFQISDRCTPRFSVLGERPFSSDPA